MTAISALSFLLGGILFHQSPPQLAGFNMPLVAVIVAFCMLNPEQSVMLYFFPVRAKYVAVIVTRNDFALPTGRFSAFLPAAGSLRRFCTSSSGDRGATSDPTAHPVEIFGGRTCGWTRDHNARHSVPRSTGRRRSAARWTLRAVSKTGRSGDGWSACGRTPACPARSRTGGTMRSADDERIDTGGFKVNTKEEADRE